MPISSYLNPSKIRIYLLLIISYAFYCYIAGGYAVFLLLSTITTFFAAKLIESAESKSKKRWALYSCLVLNFGILFFFKFQTIFHIIPNHPSVILPIGMSFYMFQSIGYMLDIYNKTLLKSESDFAKYALFVSFFPTILSGPIQKGSELLPQLNSGTKVSRLMVESGIRKLITGLFLKLVIADNLSAVLSPAFSNAGELGVGTTWITALLYPVQIYTDFLGYSLMAVGCANLLGFKIADNFNRPFFSENIPAFWRRWHISLTNWMTDYVFSPLSIILRDWGIYGLALASGFIFILVGVWHGGTINYLIFGVIHSIAISLSIIFQKRRKKFEKQHSLKNNKIYCAIRIVTTYLIVCFSFIFFRSASLHDAIGMIENLFIGVTSPEVVYSLSPSFVSAFAATLLLLIFEIRREYYPQQFNLLDNPNCCLRIISYCILIALTVWIGSKEFLPFIYFQF